MKKAKKIMKVVVILLGAFIVGLIAIHINHKIKLNKEEGLKTPLGILVEVDGHQMSIYVEGNGDKTIVFMSGGRQRCECRYSKNQRVLSFHN